ncbi:MAG: dihydroorotate dehydrogenase-like protein [Planctomycetales bacterium]|nr:dihydroorotate dehydrogenase-like protein [Planctomycetales bacterium]
MNIDFSTDYLGFKLSTPLVASAGPVTSLPQNLPRLEEFGAGAIVLPSLFAEQIEHEELAVYDFYSEMDEAHAESRSYFPEMDFYNSGRDKYLQNIELAKQSVKIPVFASLNCRAAGQWTREAKRLQDAGADAIEINIYDVVADIERDSRAVELEQVKIIESIRSQVQIPIAVKLGPYYTALPHFARQLADAGANGLVLFNRYLEPEMDLQEMSVQPHLELSRPNEMRLPLRWIAILRDVLPISLAGTSGVHSPGDAIKLIMAGADVVMMTSAMLKMGVDHMESMFLGMKTWMHANEYASITQMKGSMSRKNCPDPAGFERSNYIKAIVSYV